MDNIKLFIFDLDGVIVDTAKYHYLAWKEIAEKYRFHFSEKDNERLKGVSRMVSLDILLSIGNLSLPQQEKKIIAEIKNERYKDFISNMTPNEILPGAKEFLETVKLSGFKTALASASKNAGFILEKLNLIALFDTIIDGNSVQNAKPNPEIFLKAAQNVNVIPVHCIVFEDAQAGVQAAKAAGMRCIGVGSPKVLKDADFVISGLDKINLKTLQNILYK